MASQSVGGSVPSVSGSVTSRCPVGERVKSYIYIHLICTFAQNEHCENSYKNVLRLVSAIYGPPPIRYSMAPYISIKRIFHKKNFMFQNC